MHEAVPQTGRNWISNDSIVLNKDCPSPDFTSAVALASCPPLHSSSWPLILPSCPLQPPIWLNKFWPEFHIPLSLQHIDPLTILKDHARVASNDSFDPARARLYMTANPSPGILSDWDIHADDLKAAGNPLIFLEKFRKSLQGQRITLTESSAAAYALKHPDNPFIAGICEKLAPGAAILLPSPDWKPNNGLQNGLPVPLYAPSIAPQDAIFGHIKKLVSKGLVVVVPEGLWFEECEIHKTPFHANPIFLAKKGSPPHRISESKLLVGPENGSITLISTRPPASSDLGRLVVNASNVGDTGALNSPKLRAAYAALYSEIGDVAAFDISAMIVNAIAQNGGDTSNLEFLKMDVEGAYPHIPLDVQGMLNTTMSFEVQGVRYIGIMGALNFGQTGAGFKFELVGRALEFQFNKVLAKSHIWALRFVDDFFTVCVLHMVPLFISALTSDATILLGDDPISEKKTEHARRLNILRYVVCLNERTMSPKPSLINKLIHILFYVLPEVIPVGHYQELVVIQKLAGILHAIENVVPLLSGLAGPLYLSCAGKTVRTRINWLSVKAIMIARQILIRSLLNPALLTSSIHDVFQYSRRPNESFEERAARLNDHPDRLALSTSDASGKGVGRAGVLVMGGQNNTSAYLQCAIPKDFYVIDKDGIRKPPSINSLEAFGVVLSIISTVIVTNKHLEGSARGRFIVCQTDSQVATSYFNKPRADSNLYFIFTLLQVAIQELTGVRVIVMWVPRAQLPVADAISKDFSEPGQDLIKNSLRDVPQLIIPETFFPMLTALLNTMRHEPTLTVHSIDTLALLLLSTNFAN